MRELGLRIGLLAAAVLAGIAVIPAASASSPAGALLPSCGAMTTPFVQWGDLDSYCAFPNLGFENGATGWTLTGNASVVSGNEPWNVSGPGANALSLGPGATALSSPLPISALDPWVRFFARSNAANGSLLVRVEFQGVLGNLTGVLNGGTLSIAGYASWEPTQPVLSALAIPFGTTSARVFLESEQASGSWLVDDFYLDPCVSRVRDYTS